MWKSTHKEGTIGSENGIILIDETYKGACRITLEKCLSYYAITCGVFGAMCCTAFCDAEDALSKYENMKKELQQFIDADTTFDEKMAFYEYFTNKYN